MRDRAGEGTSGRELALVRDEARRAFSWINSSFGGSRVSGRKLRHSRHRREKKARLLSCSSSLYLRASPFSIRSARRSVWRTEISDFAVSARIPAPSYAASGRSIIKSVRLKEQVGEWVKGRRESVYVPPEALNGAPFFLSLYFTLFFPSFSFFVSLLPPPSHLAVFSFARYFTSFVTGYRLFLVRISLRRDTGSPSEARHAREGYYP